jgi:hypothetical protein
MSLFDVIKYPVSEDVTDEEFYSLPKPIRDKCIEMSWGNYTSYTLSHLVRALLLELEES